MAQILLSFPTALARIRLKLKVWHLQGRGAEDFLGAFTTHVIPDPRVKGAVPGMNLPTWPQVKKSCRDLKPNTHHKDSTCPYFMIIVFEFIVHSLLVCLCGYVFLRLSIYSYIHAFDLSVTICASFIHSFIHSLIHSFIHSSIHSFIHSFIHRLNGSVPFSFVRSFVDSFIHSFIHSSIEWVRSFFFLSLVR